MNVHETSIPGLVTLEWDPFEDDRGRFSRLYSHEILESVGIQKPIVQINLSQTVKQHVLRGMHFQRPPHMECKIVHCLQGKVWDVAVDLREGSPTFLHWHAEVLEARTSRCFVIPEGFAHGFITLEPHSELLYLHTEFYHPESEGGLLYNDPRVGIGWPHEPLELSQRDRHHPLLTESFSGMPC